MRERRPNRAAEEQHTTRAEFYRAIRPHRRSFLVTGALSAASAVAEIGVIALIGALAGRMLSDTNPIGLLADVTNRQLVAMAMTAVIAKLVLDLSFAKAQARAIYQYESTVRTRSAFLQARCGWATIEDSESGSIHSLQWTSVNRSREGFGQAIGILSNLTSLVLMLIATVIAAKWMILPVLLGLGVFSLIFRPLIGATRRSSHDLRLAYGAYGRELNESISMSRDARVLGIEETLAANLARAGDAGARAIADQSFYSSMMASGYSNALYLAVVIGFGLIAGSSITNPAPLASLVLLLYRSMGYGRSLQSSLQSIASTAPFVADVNRWLETLETSVEVEAATEPVASFSSIEFKDASLRYPNGQVGLEHVSTRIDRGDSVALVGPSGSGKSSLITILLALRDCTDGAVLVNGSPITDLDRRSWRSHLALVSQDNRLFDDTIEGNVRCWRDIPEERVLRALEQANILDEVLAMEHGIATEVGEGGKRLSGGQRQRVCLARALAGDPELLVLDEPTSALDPASERAVKESLQALKGAVTLVIIAHRMTTITICDRVLVLTDGRLEFDAPPAVVAERSAYFAQALELADGAS